MRLWHLVAQLLLWGLLRAGLDVTIQHWKNFQPDAYEGNATTRSGPGKLYGDEELRRLQSRVLDMFYHGYENYMTHAFPHDDLKPLSFSYTDSLGELGTDGSQPVNEGYQGVAMTLIDTLSTLAVVGNASEFERNVHWLTNNLSFDVDVRVNVFEANIRLLGGLLSAHLLAADSKTGPKLMPGGYNGGLLDLAYSLALRLLPAFLESPTGLPFAWVNLRHGMEGSRLITETNVAACGSLVIEMATLSRLTGNPVFEDAAVRALERLWTMRSPLGLLGSSLDMTHGKWKDASGGIGASSDSFYEYLLKAYVLFGQDEYWAVFSEAYSAALRHYKLGAWYHDAHVLTGQPTHMQFTALQSFWPGLQVLAGDILQAVDTFENFMSVWEKYGVVPERYLFPSGQLHPTEQYYALRPELIESNMYLYQATADARYLRNGEAFMDSLYKYSWTRGGWASIRSVLSHQQEDHMHSFFLAETCKYLFLLYNDTFIREGDYIFTTEGHPLPVSALLRRKQDPPHPLQPPGNATLATLQTHPFYRQQAELRGFPAAAGGPSWTHDLVAELGSQSAGTGAVVEAAVSDDAGGPPGLADEVPAAATEPPPSAPRLVIDGLWRQPAEWGSNRSSASALDARVCPRFGYVEIGSLCHVPDRYEDHTCFSDDDCGLDSNQCRSRVCTQNGFCGTVVVLTQINLAALISGSKQLQDQAGIRIETAPAPEAFGHSGDDKSLETAEPAGAEESIVLGSCPRES